MPEYLLVLEENSGGNEFITRHVLEASDRQKAKYHFHRTLKDWGYSDTQFGKHCLEGSLGMLAELKEVRRLDRHEYEVLKKHLSPWPKL